jgi:hypothetical protein
MTEAMPQWLANWRRHKDNPQPAARPEPHPRQGCTSEKPAVSAVAGVQRRARPKGNWQGFAEPARWPDDGGVRREPVLDTDHNPPRVVRTVGWRTCLCCGTPYFSEDVVALRICDTCKQTHDQKKPLRTKENRTHRGGARS